MRFSLIYRTWAFQIIHAIGPWGEQTGLPFLVGARGSDVSLGLPFPWAWRVGLQLMMPFSTGIGLERVDCVGPELGLLLGQSAGSER